MSDKQDTKTENRLLWVCMWLFGIWWALVMIGWRLHDIAKALTEAA